MVLLCVSAFGQVSIVESEIRAHLVEGRTTIALELRNESSATEGIIELAWIGLHDEPLAESKSKYPILAASSVIEVSLPLPADQNPFELRLRYGLFPGPRYGTRVAVQNGVLSLPHIADYAFSLRLVSAGVRQANQDFEIRAVTTHQVTGKPVSGVRVSCRGVSAVTDQAGVAVLRVVIDEEEPKELAVTARLGDFEQETKTEEIELPVGDVQVSTDKPIYQPGQTMHVRLLGRSGDHRVRSEATYTVTIRSVTSRSEYTTEVETSRFGIAWTDWKIPANAKAGDYVVQVDGEELNESATARVSVRAYELPSFRVSAAPERSYYLAGDQARILIHADYLFGKPVSSGLVRVTEAEGGHEEDVMEGCLDAEGKFEGSINAEDVPNSWTRFLDRHFTAYVTDSSTDRTEQRDFDLRVSAEAVHIYIARTVPTGVGRRLYITVFSPDGRALGSRVEVYAGNRLLGKGTTNRMGLIRVEVAAARDAELTVRAFTADGRHAEMKVDPDYSSSEVWLQTDRALYRQGDSIHCRLGSTRKTAAVFLTASSEDGRTLFSQSVPLQAGTAEIEVPFTKAFGRRVSLGVLSLADGEKAGTTVLYPRPDKLVVAAAPVKSTYRPGESATVRIQAPPDTALGIVIVDQSVFERNETDSMHGRRVWSGMGGLDLPELGGLDERDLEVLDPANIDSDLELAAEAIVEEPRLDRVFSEPAFDIPNAFRQAAASALEPLVRALDEAYLTDLRDPKTEAAVWRTLRDTNVNLRDPWQQPYRLAFATEGPEDIIRFSSAGPDRRESTDDDFVAREIKREWFASFRAAIEQRLSELREFPLTVDQFLRATSDGGIVFPRLRDPWGNGFTVAPKFEGELCLIDVLSPGPDHAWGTADDFTVTTFRGKFFGATQNVIERSLAGSPEFPANQDQWRKSMQAASLDFDSLRDPWGHPYSVSFRTEETPAQLVRMYSYAVYGGRPEERKQITRATRRFLIAEVSSAGPDGVMGTPDDVIVAKFSRESLEGETETRDLAEGGRPLRQVAGRGAITGLIVDASGGVVVNAVVVLDENEVAHSDQKGRFVFEGVMPGLHRLQIDSPGFQRSAIADVPVRLDEVTGVATELKVGSVEETVTVSEAIPELQTDRAASLAALPKKISGPVSTPRVRDYFPETLYWQPELITDQTGRASISVALADTVTNWRVGVVGSTMDGRIAEVSTSIRAFQPFVVDLDVPPVLTQGDELKLRVPMRNFLNTAETVSITGKAASALGLGVGRAPVTIASGSFGDAFLELRARDVASDAKLQVTAKVQRGCAGRAGDAIEKPVAVRPDGERVHLTVNTFRRAGEDVSIPADVLPGSLRSELVVYPSLMTRVLGAAKALLQRPLGCAEQTISISYTNLLFLRLMAEAHRSDEQLEERAKKNLQDGYEKLMGYQSPTGGFSYWGRGEADIAVTAYALDFLRQAALFLSVDPDRTKAASDWLLQQSSKDPATSALQLRALAQGGTAKGLEFDQRFGEVSRQAALGESSYGSAEFVLAALEGGRPELASPAVEHLISVARDSDGAAFWGDAPNTPFHSGGRPGRIETTALVVQALSAWKKAGHASGSLQALIDRGCLYLLMNVEAGGAWPTTQSTVQALRGLAAGWRGAAVERGNLIVTVNGKRAGTIVVDQSSESPISLDISPWMEAGKINQMAWEGADASSVQMQFNGDWYQPWGEPRGGKELELKTRYSTLTPGVNELVRCDVAVSRNLAESVVDSYGMMIAEVGLPPGADVDRGTLASLVENRNSGVNAFEVYPDHVTFYVSPQYEGAKFPFVFRARFAMKAKTAQSDLYDYYDPDERVTLAPVRFEVRP